MKYCRWKSALALICASLLAFSFAGCAGAPPEKTETTAALETAAPAEAVTEAPAEPEYDPTAAIEKTVLYDENDFTVTALELVREENQAVFRFRMENMGREPLQVRSSLAGASAVTVNHLSLADAPGQWDIDVGYSVEGEYVFPLETLKQYGISAISEISFVLYTDSFSTGVLTVHTQAPMVTLEEMLREEKELPDWKVEELREDGTYEQGKVRQTMTAIVQDASGNELLFLGLENTGDQPMILEMLSSQINGLTLPTFYGDMVLMPGTMGFVRVNLTEEWEENNLSQLGMEKIGSFRLRVNLYDSNREPIGTDGCMETVLDDTVPEFAVQGEPIWDKDGLEVYQLGCFDVPYDPESVGLCLVWHNTSGVPVGATPCNLSINGTGVSVGGDSITAGTEESVLGYVAVSRAELEEAGLTTSGTWEMSLMTRVGNEKKLETGFTAEIS